MNQILRDWQTVQTTSTGVACQVQQLLGGGGQGEVYKVSIGGEAMALKWYYPHYLKQDPGLRSRLEMAIRQGTPSDRFLWPLELAQAEHAPSFGYLMSLREPHFKGITDMMKRRVEPSFYALATAGYELAHNYLQLHAKGLCYRDISFGNVFFDPNTGEIRICDNDNVDVNGTAQGGVLGTPRFMAPEVVRGEAKPSTQTDLFSLAVLLFYMFMIHHPLEGEREARIHSFDLPAMTKLYGQEPVFIYDPNDASNRPVPGFHDNALAFWPVYPQFLRDLFTKAFTDGIRDPLNGRVTESIWRQTMIALRDSIVYCVSCGVENFYDAEVLRSTPGRPGTCWSCGKDLRLPPRIRIERNVVLLRHDAKLFPHHVDPQRLWDFTRPVACVTQHPTNPSIWGLKNISGDKWVSTAPDGTTKDVESERSVTLNVGTRINFGKVEGEIRI